MARRQVNLCAFRIVQSWIVDLGVKYGSADDKTLLKWMRVRVSTDIDGNFLWQRPIYRFLTLTVLGA